MNSIHHHGKSNFTMVPNELINDTRIPIQSRFLFIFLYSKPPNWKFYTPQLCKVLSMHKDTFVKYRKHLEIYKWLYVEDQTNIKGKFNSRVYHLYFSPLKNLEEKDTDVEFLGDGKKPSPKNSATEKNSDRKNSQPSNTNSLEKLTFKNKDIEYFSENENFNPNPRQK